MSPPPSQRSIASVERETGLSKDTLRAWERRYRFPIPQRDGTGARTYPPEQVEKLRLIKKLMDRGYRPGKLVGQEAGTLRTLASDAAPPVTSAGLMHYIGLCRQHRVDALRQELAQSLLRMGMVAFVTEVVAPLTTLVGTEWASGRFAVFEELKRGFIAQCRSREGGNPVSYFDNKRHWIPAFAGTTALT